MKVFIKKTEVIMWIMLVASCVFLNDSLTAKAETLETAIYEEIVQIDTENLLDNDELFAGYVEKILYADLYEDVDVYGNVGADRLTTDESKEVYRLLKEKIETIAAGNLVSTEIQLEQCLTWTAKELGVDKITSANVQELAAKKYAEVIDMTAIIGYLLMDCPYDLYWYDITNKTVSGYSCSYWSNRFSLNIILKLPVVAEYGTGNDSIYEINTELMETVVNAKNKAASIVEENKAASEYHKMKAYKEAICDMVSYHYDAAENTETPYGNPWQLIWVFDENEETKVVCEGYAKAFQYLCDLSNLNCYTVRGNLSFGTGAGAHMWNIVTLEGKNYLVDITNCDEGTIGYPDKLFLSGTKGSVSEGYEFSFGYELLFEYSDTQIGLLGADILTLAEKNYSVQEEIKTPVNEIFGDVKKDSWYFDAVQYVYDGGIMQGTSKTAFKPGDKVTRAMVVETLYKLEDKPEITEYPNFSLLKDFKQNAWWAKSVEWALANKIATGNTSTKEFEAQKKVTREALATFLHRYARDYKGIDVTLNRDVDEILGGTKVSSWAKEAFAWAIDTGIITGYTNKDAQGTITYNLDPKGQASRAQLAVILQRFLEKYSAE